MFILFPGCHHVVLVEVVLLELKETKITTLWLRCGMGKSKPLRLQERVKILMQEVVQAQVKLWGRNYKKTVK